MELQALFDTLEQHRNEEYALKMKAYMKGHFDYYGIQSKQRRELAKPFINFHKKTAFEDVKGIVNELWDNPYRDAQYIAMDLLGKHLKYLERKDLAFIKMLVTKKSWWDTVDWVAGHSFGDYLLKFQDDKYKIIEEWMSSENMWQQRSCIIHQLFYKKKTDADLLAALILEMVGSKEFFINKASGWALRQYSKTNPSWVESFIEENSYQLANLTIKEGMKWIVKNQ